MLTATGEDFTDGEATGDADVAFTDDLAEGDVGLDGTGVVFTDDLTEGDDFGVIETGTVEGVA